MNREHKAKISPLPAILFWGLVWQTAAWAMANPLLLPGPVQVLYRVGQLALTADFWQITAVSIGRILLGVAVGAALAVLLAVLTVRSPLADALITPVLTAMQATPVASFAILVLIWVDRDWVSVLICGMMVLPVVCSNVAAGIRATDAYLLEMGKLFRLRPITVLRRIWVPSVMPFFRSACSNALGLGWKAGIAAEVLTVPARSIGRQISESKLYLMTEDLFAWTMTVVILSLLLQKLMLKVLEGRDGRA